MPANMLFWRFAASTDGVWVVDLGDQVLRFDPDSGALIASIEVADPNDVAITSRLVWVSSNSKVAHSHVVTAIDPETNTVAGTVSLPTSNAPTLEVTGNDVWVSDSRNGTLTRIDPNRLSMTATVQLTNPDTDNPVFIEQFAADSRGLWVIDSANGAVYRIDPTTGTARGRMRIAPLTKSLVAGAGSIWIPDSAHDAVVRLTP